MVWHIGPQIGRVDYESLLFVYILNVLKNLRTVSNLIAKLEKFYAKSEYTKLSWSLRERSKKIHPWWILLDTHIYPYIFPSFSCFIFFSNEHGKLSLKTNVETKEQQNPIISHFSATHTYNLMYTFIHEVF